MRPGSRPPRLRAETPGQEREHEGGRERIAGAAGIHGGRRKRGDAEHLLRRAAQQPRVAQRDAQALQLVLAARGGGPCLELVLGRQAQHARLGEVAEEVVDAGQLRDVPARRAGTSTPRALASRTIRATKGGLSTPARPSVSS